MTLALVVDHHELALTDLGVTARAEHGLVVEAGESLVHHAILAGEALLAAKTQVPHGQWEQWLADNLPVNATTPRVYMRLARHKEQVLSRGMPTGLREAARLIGGAPDSRFRPELKGEAQRLADEGMNQAAIARELGIAPSTVWRWLNPKAEKERLRKARRQTIAGRRALNRERRDADVKRAGGHVAEAYSLIRRALQSLDQAADTEENRDARRAVNTAIARLHTAEDEIVKAVRLRD